MKTFEEWSNLNDDNDNFKKDFIEDVRYFKSDLYQFMAYWDKRLKETDPNSSVYKGKVDYKYPKPHTEYDVSIPYQDFLNSRFKEAERRNKERISKYLSIDEEKEIKNNTNFPITNIDIKNKVLNLSYQLENILTNMYDKTINKDDYQKLKKIENELSKILNNMNYYDITNKKTGWNYM